MSGVEAFESNGASGSVTVSGSSSVSPLMQKLIEGYNTVNPNVDIELQTSDSTTGMTDAINGMSDIGMASRELKQEELDAGLVNTVIATDGIAIIVNNESPITDLTTEQVRDIYLGNVTDWSEAGLNCRQGTHHTEKGLGIPRPFSCDRRSSQYGTGYESLQRPEKGKRVPAGQPDRASARDGDAASSFWSPPASPSCAVALICIYLFANGLPAIAEIGPVEFLLGTDWRPNADHVRHLPHDYRQYLRHRRGHYRGRASGAAGRHLHGQVLSQAPLYKVYEARGGPAGGHPLHRLRLLRPDGHRASWCRTCSAAPSGQSILTASILLGIMILPTIISVSESSIRAVPDSYYEGALALGASHERSVFFVTVPAAKSGIMAGHHPGRGPGHWRDHGCDYDCRQPAPHSRQPSGGRSHPHRQHRYGNGLRPGPAPGGPHRHRRGAVRVYSHH